MNYISDFYPRLYSIIDILPVIWLVCFFVAISLICCYKQDNTKTTDKMINYIVKTMIISLIIVVLLWIFTPTPEYLGF